MGRRRIAILSKEAFARINPESKNPKAEEEWRHEQQFLAVGKESLRDCLQDDYLRLKAWFENLAGETGRAVKTHMADAVSDHEIVMRKLEAECAARGLAIEYPAAICLRQYKCELEKASPNQLWQLVFTVRNRRKVRAGQAAGAKREMECPF